MLLTSVVAVAPWGADRAHAAPVFSFDLVTRSCPDFVQLMPVFASTPGLNYTIEFTVTVRGDAASRPAVYFLKENRGYDFFRGADWLGKFVTPTIVSGVDWNVLGANPRVTVTSTYGLGTDPVNTVVGPSYTFPLTAVSDPMLTRGTGTVADPFLVGTPTEVWNMGCYAAANKNFRFDSDVDLAGYTQFMPLGAGSGLSGGRPFNGTIDGAGYTVRNLRIVNPNFSDLGFVGNSNNGLLIDNLRFENARVEGRKYVSVVLGVNNNIAALRRVSVATSQVRAQESGGLLVGDAEGIQITSASTNGTVSGRPDAYTGVAADAAAINEIFTAGQVTDIGGLVGSADNNLLISDVVVDHTVNAVTDQQAQYVGGLAGDWDADHGLVTRVTGSVAVDITAGRVGTGTSSVAGLFGGQGLEDSSFTRSTLHADVVVRAPATANAVTFQDIGAVVGQSGEAHYETLMITGSVTVDARLATGNVTLKEIGGLAGDMGDSSSNTSMVKNVDVDVDVTVLGDARSGGVVQPIERVGALTGAMRYVAVFDVVVGGSVSIAGRADGVGGLVGEMRPDGSSSYLPTVLNGLVYRGSGAQVGAGSTNVGPAWGVINGAVPAANAPFTNVWWDSDRNGITSTTASVPALPATSAQLGTSSWLAARGFDMSVWCVSGGRPAIILLGAVCDSVVVSVPVVGGPSAGRVADRVRVGGVNRFATAVSLSQRFFGPRVAVVYLATAEDFADALAAGPLAAGNGPVLMVLRNEIPAATLAELRRLNPARVIVLGGPAAVSDAVLETARATTTGSVTRLFGDDRYGTAVAITQTSHAGGASVVYIATGADFADALGGGPRAMLDGGPILLVQRDAIPASTRAELQRLSPDRIVVLGGPDAVSESVARELRAFAPAGLSRLAGVDRYATAVAVSQAGFEPGVDVVFLANGRGYGDALPAGAVAGGRGPVLLVREDCVPMGVMRELERLQAREVIMVGGLTALGDGVTSLRQCAS